MSKIEYIEVNVKIPKEIQAFAQELAKFLRMTDEELLNEAIKLGIEAIITRFELHIRDFAEEYSRRSFGGRLNR